MKFRTVASFVALALFVIVSPAFAEEAASAGNPSAGLIALGAGLGMGIAAFGTAIGQGLASAAAMESIGRNPNSVDKIFTPFLLGLALMEALSLYALVVAFMLLGKF